MHFTSTLSLLRHVFGQQLLRKRTIASGGSHASAGKSLRKRQKSPQVGRDRETCGNHRQVAPEPGPRRGTSAGVEMDFPRRLACERRSSSWSDSCDVASRTKKPGSAYEGVSALRRILCTAAAVLVVAFLAPAVPRGQEHGAASYISIDGKHLKGYVDDLTAISRRYRDHGHPQFWGRIIGTEADAENARWLMDKFKAAGLSDVREQSFDLAPQWMAQSWRVTASASGKTLPLNSAQPTYRSEVTPPTGLDLEAVDVDLATDADLAGRDLKGKAVFFYSTDYMSRHISVSNGAIKRIGDKGAAAIF